MNKLHNIGLSLIVLGMTAAGHTQHRGDNLSFQGLSLSHKNSVRAAAMGGAFTGGGSDLGAIYFNPAGLSGIEDLQISVSAAILNKLWQENQDYRPNRFQMTLPFYLERLYIPNPENNGKWDYDIFNEERDSTYFVNPPRTGEDRYSEAVADWQVKKDLFKLDNVAIAYPVSIGERTLTLAGAYSRKYDVLDYDRNDSYLDPHIGYDEYGVAERVTNDTLHMNWYEFERSRSGSINNITVAASFDISRHIVLGLGINRFSGDTEESQSLDKVGWFDITNNNKFMFSYDTLQTAISGSSSFLALNSDVGLQIRFEKISLGLNVTTPFTIERKWSHSTTFMDSSGTRTQSTSGTDKMSVPLSYRFGVSFTPIRQFQLLFDLESIPYQKNSFELADTAHREWVNVNILRFGFEYKPFDRIGIMAGYRTVTEAFVPDGAAFRDHGPTSEAYTMGISIFAIHGRFDAAYEMRSFKYYDSYYSNTNFALEKINTLRFGYTFIK